MTRVGRDHWHHPFAAILLLVKTAFGQLLLQRLTHTHPTGCDSEYPFLLALSMGNPTCTMKPATPRPRRGPCNVSVSAPRQHIRKRPLCVVQLPYPDDDDDDTPHGCEGRNKRDTTHHDTPEKRHDLYHGSTNRHRRGHHHRRNVAVNAAILQELFDRVTWQEHERTWHNHHGAGNSPHALAEISPWGT